MSSCDTDLLKQGQEGMVEADAACLLTLPVELVSNLGPPVRDKMFNAKKVDFIIFA